ncbi:unnamed protein product [Cuscuta epithymum]|uniref:Serine/threonine protein phosphatase 4 regulatory subunit n=1 Tax=Cuscuta epithymum TaxID=186058 RepID=A0AAV0EW23_9ASTE|nr:unnamed protein product [Cuscuta epithymum]
MENPQEISGQEGRRIMEEIAATGKCWHDWDKLKRFLSFYLKQILSDYPDSKLTHELQQISAIGEPFPDLVKRLDHDLNSFTNGPPFTLQRLCEILLDPRSIYPKLSKLALALEKNLLVASTLTISDDPSTATMQKAGEPETEPSPLVSQHPSSNLVVPNGVETRRAEDTDEVMGEVEGNEAVDDGITTDMETSEVVRSETIPTVVVEPARCDDP